MKMLLGKAVAIVLSICLLLGLCSCRMKESYNEFNIKSITDNLNDDYFISENFTFATVENVVIIPEIKAVNHEEYIVYISAYSKTGEEIVQVNNMIFKDNENVLLNRESGQVIKLEENADGIYEGWIDGGTFTKETLDIADGKEYDFAVEVEIINEDVQVSKEIVFEVVVKGYKSFVFPT